jgi:hypothetical protein
MPHIPTQNSATLSKSSANKIIHQAIADLTGYALL